MKSPSTRLRPRGFSLVVTLALMVLLTLIAFGLLTLSTISVRSSAQVQDMAEARGNARFAMMMALSQLQRQAGPDQRVTAPANVVTASGLKNPNWIGVWATTDHTSSSNKEPAVNRPVVGAYENPAYLTDLRESVSYLSAGRWKTELQLGWLVSGDSPKPTVAFNALTDVKLVDTGSVATTAGLVWAPKVKLPRGSYAYWVSDESTKAHVSASDPYAGKTPAPANGSDGGYYRLAGAEPPNVSRVLAGSKTPYGPLAALNGNDRTKVVSLPQVGLVATPADIKNNFHDLTACSMSVLTNARAGGLKTDLTTLLEQSRSGGNRGVKMASNPLSVKQVLPETPVIDGDWHKYSGPRFDHLFAWYRLMDELTGSKVGDYSLSPRYLDARAVTAERGITEGWTVNHLAKNGATFSQVPVTIQPALVDFKLQFDFSRDAARAGGRAIRAHLYPRLVLWNPYNVKLKGKRYVIMAPLYPWDNLQVGGTVVLKDISGDPNSGQLFPGTPNGFAFAVEPTDFEPGECLVFTPKTSASGGAVVGGNSAPYDGTDVAKNLLSATKPSDRQNFHFPSGWRIADSVDLTLMQIPYGIAQDVNACIATGQLAFLLKRAPDSGSIPPASLYQDKAYATVGRYVCHYQGHGDYYWWYVPGMSNNGANDAPYGFVRHEDYPERNPPRLWFTEARQRWFDETMEQTSLGQQWGKGSAAFYNVPLIAAYNVRAPIVHRSQFCFYDDWTRYSPGGFMIPWASERTFGTPKEPPFVNGKALGSPWGLAGDWSAVSGRYPLFDLPAPDVGVFSLADFQHAQIGFQTWQPSYVIGHSLAEARSDRNATAKRDYVAAHPVSGTAPSGAAGDRPWDINFRKAWTAIWSDLIQVADQPDELQAYDITYETNHYLWDDYFLSTIPFRRGGSSPQITWDVTKPLPNGRLVLNPWLDISATTLAKNLTSPPAGAGYGNPAAYPFHHAAWFLLDDGGFNVNSTSAEAWRAVLSTLRDQKRPTMTGSDVTGNAFSRLLAPRSNLSNPSALISDAAWNGVRTLSDTEIKTLADAIVTEVKLRGPFLSVSDFVNRRLTTGLTGVATQGLNDTSVRGPLQAAIERANINRVYQSQGSALLATNRTGGTITNGSGGFLTDYDAMPDWKAFGLPTYLTQADILQQIGPHLTVRGDTFVIRSYGEKTDSQGNVLARAWCEAVVQRLPEFVDGRAQDDYTASGPGNHPIEPLNIPKGNSLTANSRITATNLRFGRKFVLTSFRWLQPNEI